VVEERGVRRATTVAVTENEGDNNITTRREKTATRCDKRREEDRRRDRGPTRRIDGRARSDAEDADEVDVDVDAEDRDRDDEEDKMDGNLY
jgi:hypothetical protein